MTKNWKKLQLKIFVCYFLDQKSQFTYPLASLKDVQATREVFSPSVIFALLDPDSESGSTDLIESGSQSGQDPKH
jgi:hypothetical protein